MSTEKTPVFVVGPLRSGTTFLRLILGMHPSLDMFGEFEEAVAFLPEQGWPDAEAYRQWLSTHRAFLAKKLDVDAATDNVAELTLDFWRQLAERTESPLMGGSIHSNFHRCPDLWPDAKYIHLLRDPRDVARSCIGMGWVGNVYFGTDYWLEAERNWERLKQRTRPEQRYEVRYEELVRDPVTVLTGICQFLGIEYDPVLLDYPQHSTYGPPDPKLAEQWRRKLEPEEVQWVEARAQDMMRQRGYELQTSAHSPEPLKELQLRLHNRYERAAFGVRRFGVGLWLKGRISKLAPGSEFSRRTKLQMNEVVVEHLR